MLKFIQYNGKERKVNCVEYMWDSLTQTQTYITPRGTQYERDQQGNIRRIHPCNGKRIKIGNIE